MTYPTTLAALLSVALAAGALRAQPTVLVDALPSAAALAGESPLRLPFKDADAANPKDIERGINGAITQFLPLATQQGFSYVCLISAPGEQPIGIPIAAAHATLNLSRKNSAVHLVFYRGGHAATVPVTYSTGKPGKQVAIVQTTINLVGIRKGGSVAGWVYLNLPRIQAEAEKGAEHTVFLQTQGQGPVVSVPIPGLKDPLLVHEQNVSLTLTWSMDPKMAATHRGTVMGHPVPAPTAPATAIKP